VDNSIDPLLGRAAISQSCQQLIVFALHFSELLEFHFQLKQFVCVNLKGGYIISALAFMPPFIPLHAKLVNFPCRRRFSDLENSFFAACGAVPILRLVWLTHVDFSGVEPIDFPTNRSDSVDQAVFPAYSGVVGRSTTPKMGDREEGIRSEANSTYPHLGHEPLSAASTSP